MAISALYYPAALWQRIPFWVKATLAAIALVVFLVVTLLLFAGWQWHHDMEAGRKTLLYKTALSRVQASADVARAMGRPVWAGQVDKVIGEDKRHPYFIVFELNGSKANGRVFVTGGDKTYPNRLTELSVFVMGEQSKDIDLIPFTKP